MDDEKPFRSYRDLDVWRLSIELAEEVYVLTGSLPREELYGLSAQMRAAAVSIAANIAEGHGRETPGSFVQFLRVSQGSLKELETHIIIAGRVKILSNDLALPALNKCDRIGRMIRSLVRSLQRNHAEN
jgi:four helix bundle protein